MSDANILEMNHINKSFAGVRVLEDIHFTLGRGEVHALVGGNGAGKSTLMKILTGVYTKDSGTMFIDGEEKNFLNYSDASEAGVRMIFQEMSIIPTMTVAENIFLNAEKKKGILLDKKSMMEEAAVLLKKFNIDLKPSREMSALSVGYCQLVEIAKALSKDARILVMDEPTASLSTSEVTRLFEIVRLLKEKGVSIVYISHRMDEILKIADKVTVLRDGKNVVTEKAEKMTVPIIVSHIMGNTQISGLEHKTQVEFKDAKDVLTVEHLHVNDLVKDVSFSIKEGEVVGLAGLMGSGRTEILEALFGIRKILGGSVSIGGEKVRINSVKDAMDQKLALVPEDRRREGLVLNHSIRENIQLTIFPRIKKRLFLDNKKIRGISENALKKLNIKANSIDQKVFLLSGGNQQKVAIAKWLETFPKLLLLDEPTAGIDVGAKGEIINLVKKYAEEGNSILLVSSEIQEMVAMCDRVIVLRNGQVVKEISGKDGLNEEVVQNAIQ